MDSAAPDPGVARVDRGEAGEVLRELRARDYIFTVLESRSVTAHFHRVKVSGNGFLQDNPPYPTMWVRLWFEDDSGTGQGHQRAYTIVDPNVTEDTFWLEFALHEGAASRWAVASCPGDHIEASLYGSEPSLPENERVDTHLLVGDTASLPAINSLLGSLNSAPAVIVLEWVHDDDRTLAVRTRPQDNVVWVERTGEGAGLVETVAEHLDRLAPSAQTDRIFAWASCDTVTTRCLTRMFRDAGIGRHLTKTLGYWLPERDQALAG